MKKKPAPKPKRGRPFTGGREPIRSIRVADDLWSRWQAAAAKEGKPVSQWIREACEEKLR